MAVSLVPKFTRAEIAAFMEQQQQRIFDAVLLRLRRIGEQFVKDARENGTYKDRTGNLRSSIGYVILRDGVQLYDNFRRFPGQEGKGKSKGEGMDTARKVIEEIKAKFPRGFVLICVAGMDYAAAVESRGLDVLTASSIAAEVSLKKAIKDIQSKISKR